MPIFTLQLTIWNQNTLETNSYNLPIFFSSRWRCCREVQWKYLIHGSLCIYLLFTYLYICRETTSLHLWIYNCIGLSTLQQNKNHVLGRILSKTSPCIYLQYRSMNNIIVIEYMLSRLSILRLSKLIHTILGLGRFWEEILNVNKKKTYSCFCKYNLFYYSCDIFPPHLLCCSNK